MSYGLDFMFRLKKTRVFHVIYRVTDHVNLSANKQTYMFCSSLFDCTV